MKRFHLHIGVENLEQSIRFYSTLFAAEPTVRKPDYAKWMLEDPRVNFAISERRNGAGIHHLGIQAEDGDELREIHSRLETAGGEIFEEGQVTCCYARSEKSWTSDPQNISWETFHTLGESTVYGGCGPVTENADEGTKQDKAAASCCGPAAPAKSGTPCCGSAA
jgi:hypothetical protein